MNEQEILALISKPTVMPKNIANIESFKQALNYYHRVMVKRVEITATKKLIKERG